MADHALLGIDLGAGGLKVSAVSLAGTLLGEASEPLETSIPAFGWAEQDPESWWEALLTALPRALAAAGLRAEAVRGIAVSGGAHIPVLLDAADRVIRPAILWSDQRSAAEARELHERAGAAIIATSLNRVNPTWTLAMLLWLKRHEPRSAERARKLMLSKDYLRFRLTGSWETDYSDVIGALMADHRTRAWSPELCRLIDWPLETLPPVVEPAAVVGGLTPAAAAALSLRPGTPVICGSNDTTVEFFGIGATRPGMAAIKLATAGVLFLATEGPVVKPPISCYPHVMPGMYYLATGTNSCASAHRWLRDRMFLAPGGEGSAAFAEMDRLAATVPAGADGLLFHPYLQGERAPYWDPLLRADFIGLTMQHGRAHFARALYEGIAFSIRDLLDTAKGFGLEFGATRLIGGGSRSLTWRQIIADVTGLAIEKPENGDASFGAALLAGIGIGAFASPEDAVERCVRVVGRAEPNAERHRLYGELFAVYKDAQAALAPLSHRLHGLVAR
ncbi:MAG TPA: xylulokinase [Methylomirabilota bacterium]|jgi:xylulokinase|nr:xylulokinase [Methylomirabilota bacterium]